MIDQFGARGSTLSFEVAGKPFALAAGQRAVIGRSPEASIIVESQTLSRRHLEVGYEAQGWVARDLGTLNGTFVSGTELPRGAVVPLVAGSQLWLGDPGTGVPFRVIGIQAAPLEAQSPPLDGRRVLGPDPTTGLTVSQDVLKLIAVASAERGPFDASPHGFQPQAKVITIGRDPDNSLVIHDPLVSAHHARLTAIGPGRYRVDDLRSTNGTFVNGRRVTSAEIGEGDVLTIEKVFLRITSEGLQRVGQTAERSGPGSRSPSRRSALIVSDVSFAVHTTKGEQKRGLAGTKKLLDAVTFTLPERSLLAVIGPSGAGKSTMLKTMTGMLRADSGSVTFKGLDMAVFADSLAHQIGVVPQDDLVHVELSARHALEYAARLRFPDDSAPTERGAAVDWAIRELGLTTHADTPIRQMSGGQRKRVSTAMELLTRPELLFLDEPTSGLDPNLDREVMELLAQLAHGTAQSPDGRTVVVITHSTANLDKADNVLLLAPGGRVAYFGPPGDLVDSFAPRLPRGDTSYASIYELLTRDPEGAQRAFAAGRPRPVATPVNARPAPDGQAIASPKAHLLPQAVTLLSRQLRLTAADTSLLVFMAVLPIAMGLLTLAVGAKNGFKPSATTKAIADPKVLMVILVFGAVLMGMVPSVRQLVGERAIYQREAHAGVRPSAYLGSKLLTLGLINFVQALLLVQVALAVNPHPDKGLFAPLWLELTVVAFVVAWCSASIGLLLSALVTTSEQVMPLMVVVLMLQLVLSGGVIGVTGPIVNQASWLIPSRWGFAAGASSLDFNHTISCHLQQMVKKEQDDETNKRAKEATDKANAEAADAAQAQGVPVPTPKVPENVQTVVDCDEVDDLDLLWDADLATWIADLLAMVVLFSVSVCGTYLALRRSASPV